MHRSRSSRALFLAAAVLASTVFQIAYAQEGVDEPVRTTPVAELQVSRSSNYLAWSQKMRNRPNHTNVYAKPDGGRRFKVNARGTEGQMGSLDGNRLIFQQFTRRTSALKVMNLATRRVRNVAKVNSRRWEFWPRMQGRWVLYGRRVNRAGDQKLLLTNIRSGATRALASLGARVYLLPGQINGDYVVWGEQRPGGVAKVKRYQISSQRKITVPNSGAYNWGPSVTPRGTVYFSRSGARCGTNTAIFRWRPGAGANQVIDLPNGTDLGVSFAFVTAAGKVQVFHDRATCSRLETGIDLYRFTDPFTVTLTMTTSGNRTGTVTARGIDCGADCTQDFEPGSTVTLTATPEEGARFDAWSDSGCGTNPTCTITITTDTTIDASFRP